MDFFAFLSRSAIEWKKASLEQAFTNHHYTEQFGYISRSKARPLVSKSKRRNKKPNEKKNSESQFGQKVYIYIHILKATIELC